MVLIDDGVSSSVTGCDFALLQYQGICELLNISVPFFSGHHTLIHPLFWPAAQVYLILEVDMVHMGLVFILCIYVLWFAWVWFLFYVDLIMIILFTKNIHKIESILGHVLKQNNHSSKHIIKVLMYFCSACLTQNLFFLFRQL